jgi:transcriptional regulator with XRE-family HTH domain
MKAGHAKRRATAVDVAIGQKLRALRLARGLSQTELARMIGVTFQQLQKYETGGNRISAGRLAVVAAVLGVPVTTFYGILARPERERIFTYLRSKGAVRLARAYGGIAERAARVALVRVAEALARP